MNSDARDTQPPPAVDDAGNRDLPERTQPAEGEPAAPEVVAELEDRLLRTLADLDNLRKRYNRELARERAAERARAAQQWLPVVDNLERALQHADADVAPLVEGVRAVHDEALAVLERLGFPRFDDIGLLFDPTRHEAVATVEADAPDRTVVATVRPGYGTSQDVLRPAGVVVARPPE